MSSGVCPVCVVCVMSGKESNNTLKGVCILGDASPVHSPQMWYICHYHGNHVLMGV